MNAIGPIETQIKANHAAVRARLFATAQYRVISKAKPDCETPEQRKRSVLATNKLMAKYRRFDIIYGGNVSRAWRIRAIKEQVAYKHDVSISCLDGIGRFKPYVLARQEAMHRCYTEIPNMTLQLVGAAFGGRDHTTVLHAIRSHEKRIKAAQK